MEKRPSKRKTTDDTSNEQTERTAQERAYDEVVRGRAGVDQPPGPQDALTEDAAEAEGQSVDDREARRAAEDVRERERSADRHTDPAFRRTGG